MRVILKSISMSQFKGIKEKTFVLDGSHTQITGRNASGKTTIANAFYWLIADKDIDLNSNPNVKPLGVEECQPTVTIVIDVDGKEVELCKSQKIKTSKPDENGIVKSSSTNTYMINQVPKTERDFKAYLDELGMPTTDDLLMMSHTNVFTGMKNADMRSTLFKMVKSQSDKDIAVKIGNVPELAALLENYTLEEVTAMQKASQKKAKEQLESIPSQIEGLELAKTEDRDTAETELLISSLNEQIASEQAKSDEIKAESAEYSSLLQTKLKLDFDRNSELERMNTLANSGRDELEEKLNRAANALVDAKRHVNVINTEISQYEQSLTYAKAKFENLKVIFTNAKALEFDESKTICPCCGQAYPEAKKAEIKEAFEKDKKAKMDDANQQAKTIQGEIKNYEASLAKANAELEEAKTELEQREAQNKQYNYDLENFKPSEVKPSVELQNIEQKIADNQKAIDEIKSHNNDERLAECKMKISQLQAQLAEANKVIGASSNNVRIDEQIESLQNQQIELEQAKADCEKILFQVELLSREKNNLVADEINSYFKLVDFKLWEMQKNGNIKDCCTPLHDGKELGVATNTALEIEMKLDICQGLQRFNGIKLPIFADGMELADSETLNRITTNTDTQLIIFKVSDDELKVES